MSRWLLTVMLLCVCAVPLNNSTTMTTRAPFSVCVSVTFIPTTTYNSYVADCAVLLLLLLCAVESVAR